MSWCTLYRALCAVLVFQGVSAIVAATTVWSGLLQSPLSFPAFVTAQGASVVAASIRYVIPGADLRFVALGGALAMGALTWLGSTSLAGPSLVELSFRAAVWLGVLAALRGLWPRVGRVEERERLSAGDAAA